MSFLPRLFPGLLMSLCILLIAAVYPPDPTIPPGRTTPLPARTPEKPAVKTPAKTTTAAVKTKAEDPAAAAKASGWGTYLPIPAQKPVAKKPPVKTPPKKKPGAAEEETPVEKTLEERNQERLEHFKKTGILFWPEFSEEDLAEIDKDQREKLGKIRAAFPQNPLHYYETAHFFYVTDAPADMAKNCCVYLEKGYARLSEIFSIPPDAQFWKGKCIVVAFVRQQDFAAFEQIFYKNIIGGANAGFAHMNSLGDVLISLYYGDVSTPEKQLRFLGTMVHESTHGFMHRYKSSEQLPLWFEEGIAEFLAGVIVTQDKQIGLKQKNAMQAMQQLRSLNGLMTTTESITVWQYGAASGLVSFLIKSKPPGGVGQMVNLIKDGTAWQDALNEVYNVTPEQLVTAFGNACKIQGLRP